MRFDFSFSKKRFITSLFLIIFALAGAMFFDSTSKFMAIIVVMFLCGGICHIKLRADGVGVNNIFIYIIYLMSMIAAAAITVFVVQKLNDSGLPSLYKLILNCLTALLVISLGCSIEALFTKRPGPWGIIISSALLVILGLANYFLYVFRGNSLSPVDFLTLGTAVNFVGNYKYEITRFIYNSLVIYFASSFFLSGIRFDIQVSKISRFICPALISIVLLFSLPYSFSKGSLRSHYDSHVGCWENGLLLNFAMELKESFVAKPDSYTNTLIQQAEKDHGLSPVPIDSAPNIIVIMNESFADHRIHGDLKLNQPIMPFFDSLEENTIKGYALSSVYGGMTPNSEFEFLTGSSMAFLPSYAVPFQQYISGPVFSFEHYLEKLGYTSFAAHPADIANWSRYKIYPYLGFDNYSFIEDFNAVETLDGYVSDWGLYQYIIEKYEAMEGDSNKFIYAVTMQNHSPYVLVGREEPGISSEACNNWEADIYFSRILESDRALEKLISHFESVDEPVVILMFGDHQPAFADSILWTLQGGSDGSLQTQMLRYIVPFMIWTNYDIEECYVEISSLNYLSNYLLDTAGLPLSPYNSFLSQVQEIIPAVNAHGYYSLSDNCFKRIDEAQGAEKEALQNYACLQYNAFFDKDNKSDILFPVND